MKNLFVCMMSRVEFSTKNNKTNQNNWIIEAVFQECLRFRLDEKDRDPRLQFNQIIGSIISVEITYLSFLRKTKA